jgi:hypothetical protein
MERTYHNFAFCKAGCIPCAVFPVAAMPSKIGTDRYRRTTGLRMSALQFFDFSSQIFLRFTELLLKSPKELVLLALGEREIVISQLPVFLFEFAFQFIPTAFDFQIRHSALYSRAEPQSVVLQVQIDRIDRGKALPFTSTTPGWKRHLFFCEAACRKLHKGLRYRNEAASRSLRQIV